MVEQRDVSISTSLTYLTLNSTSRTNATLLLGMHHHHQLLKKWDISIKWWGRVQLLGLKTCQINILVPTPYNILSIRSDIFCPRGQGKEPREQINGITAFIDGSMIYGSDSETSLGLRDGAKLKTHSEFGKEHLPKRSQCGFPEGNPNPTDKDLTAGDVRALVQPTLTSIHTLFLNEHNRIVESLTELVDNSSNEKITNLTAKGRENFVFEVKMPRFWLC